MPDRHPLNRSPFAAVLSLLFALLVLLAPLNSAIAGLKPPARPKTAAGTSNGLVQCYPQPAADSPSDLGYFGDACGLYLTLSVAGRLELGRSPLLYTVERLRRQRGFPGMRLTVGEANQIATRSGATHIAVGAIAEKEGKVTLSYRIHNLKGTPVKGEVRLEGTRAEIVKRLPAYSNQLAAVLGLKPTAAPPVGATAAEMVALGQCLPDRGFTLAQQEVLAALAPGVPLAGLLLLRTSYADLNQYAAQRAARLILRTFPQNPLVLGVVGVTYTGILAERVASMEKWFAVYPKNYGLAQALTWAYRHLGNDSAEEKAARNAVRLSPLNPDTHLVLGNTISDTADEVRQGRFYNQMSDAEKQMVGKVYDRWLKLVARAVELDPQFSRAWVRVSTAAAFAGHAEAAAAWERAYQLPGRESYEVFWWGIQLFQPKWHDNPEKLAQVALEAANTDYDQLNTALSIASSLQNAGMGTLSSQMLSNLLAKWQAAVESKPGVVACFHVATMFQAVGEIASAMEAFKTATRLAPQDPDPYFQIGLLLAKENRLEEALAPLQRAVKLDPRYKEAYAQLGFVLKHLNRLEEAEAALRRAVAIDPDYADGYVILGTVLTQQFLNSGYDRTRGLAALAAYKKAKATRPVFELFHNSSLVQVQLGQWDAALQSLEKLRQMRPEDPGYWITTSHCHLMKKQWKQAEETARRALQFDSNNPFATSNLGVALLYQKKKEEGRSYCERALALDGGRNPGFRDEIDQAYRDNP